MADQTLNLDGYTAAVTTAASKWFEAVATGEKSFGSVDFYFPATTTAGSKWFESVIDAIDKGAHQDGYVPGVVTNASRWRNAEAVGDQRPANFWTVVPTTWRVTVYKMRGMDAAVSGLYDTWLVTGAPDTTGANYHGAFATPLRDILVIDAWVYP
jgi:hypothetical protein